MKKYSVLLLVVALAMMVVFTACTKAGDGGDDISSTESQTVAATEAEKVETEPTTEPETEEVTEEMVESELPEDTEYFEDTEPIEPESGLIIDSDFPEEPLPTEEETSDKQPEAGPINPDEVVVVPETTKTPETTKAPETTKEPEKYTLPPLGNYEELPTVPAEWD